MGVRLVVLSPEYAHISKATNSAAREQVAEILNKKGTAPRYFKNLLVFLVADKSKRVPLEQAISQFLAWDSVVNEESLDLSAAQKNQATAKLEQARKDVNTFLSEAYHWLLVPQQPDPQGAIEWSETRLQGNDSLILKASRKLVHEEHLIVNYAANRLRLEALDRYLWRDTNHLDLKRLWDYLAQYLYLPRLRGEKVLLQAIQDGVNAMIWTDNFAYATGWDEAKQRYLGLKAGANNLSIVSIGSQNLIVKPEIAQHQFEADEAAQQAKTVALPKTPTASETSTSTGGYCPSEIDTPPPPPARPTRFYDTVKLDPLRLSRDIGQISEAVLQHLMGLVDAELEITIDINATVSDGIPENVQRIVNENCRTLKFNSHEFDKI